MREDGEGQAVVWPWRIVQLSPGEADQRKQRRRLWVENYREFVWQLDVIEGLYEASMKQSEYLEGLNI